jgi:hypothetical protein
MAIKWSWGKIRVTPGDVLRRDLAETVCVTRWTMPEKETSPPDPLRRRIEAVLSRSWYRTVDDEGRRVKEIDEARAAAELAGLVGPLVATTNRLLASFKESADSGDWGNWEFEDQPEVIAVRAALAAIDGPIGAEGE